MEQRRSDEWSEESGLAASRTNHCAPQSKSLNVPDLSFSSPEKQ